MVVGFIGLGNMGQRMAHNLLRSGLRLVVHDARPEACHSLVAAGAIAAATPAELMTRVAEMAAQGTTSTGVNVMTMLPNSEHVQAVYTGAHGLLDSAPAGSLLVDCSTISPSAAVDIGKEAVRRGCTFLDAPVSGGVIGAEEATLTLMVGAAEGEDGGLERARSLLAHVGKKVVHCGGVGSGQAAKLANNMVLAVSMVAVSEGMLLGKKLGVDPKVLATIFNTSSARCWSSDTYNPVPGVMDGVPAARGYEGGFATALMQKDLALAAAAAREVGAPTAACELAQRLYGEASARGLQGKDFGSIYQHLEQLAEENKR